MEIDDQLCQVLEQYFRFGPSPFDAVTYYLPLLISGKLLPPAAELLIHRTDVYACDLEVLVAQYDHVPLCGATRDRFFFTPCKRLKWRGNRSHRTVGNDGGSWGLQHTKPINNAVGVKVGEHKTLVHSKADERTKWLMDEYRCFPCPQEALVAGAEMVMCKIHFSKTEAEKRPPPVAADRLCVKKMRAAPSSTPPVVHPDRSPVFTPPPPPAYAPLPVSLPVPPAPAPAAADGDEDRFFCSMDELLCGAQDEEAPPLDDKQPAEQQLPVLASDASLEQGISVFHQKLTDSLEDEFGFIQDKLPENSFPLIGDLQELIDDFHNFEMAYAKMLGGSEQQLPSLASGLQELIDDYNNFEMAYANMLGGSEQQLPILVSDDYGGILASDEVENMDIDQFATSLEDDLCGAQDEEALPADDKQPEQLLPLPDPFTNAEFNEMLNKIQVDENLVFSQDEFAFIQGELSEDSFPLMDDFQEPNFAMSSGNICGGGEQQAVSTSGELLGRYRSMFTLDQLERHREFISYA